MPHLSKGANAPVAAPAVRAVLEWPAGPGVPAPDLSALLSSAAGRVRSDADFVFYNQPERLCGAVRYLGGQGAADAFEVDSARVEPGVDRVVVCASADGAPFGRIAGSLLRLLVTATGAEIARFDIAAGSGTASVYPQGLASWRTLRRFHTPVNGNRSLRRGVPAIPARRVAFR
ncbi:TerD family protein [Nocardia sp. CY41]|uniref:TerD family protein n=1 Tax=Nocardia sp. CY41 TaxID=2608686 RepID=UPI001916BAFE|nr:TerD family protein [Nocardia sp. CY41]